jgi:hypothetical protein
MTTEQPKPGRTDSSKRRAAGMPGDGAGQREVPGRTGVHPASAGWPEGDMEIVREGEWGQGERGLDGYQDHGESELSPTGNQGAAEGGGSLISQPDDQTYASGSEPSRTGGGGKSAATGSTRPRRDRRG